MKAKVKSDWVAQVCATRRFEERDTRRQIMRENLAEKGERQFFSEVDDVWKKLRLTTHWLADEVSFVWPTELGVHQKLPRYSGNPVSLYKREIEAFTSANLQRVPHMRGRRDRFRYFFSETLRLVDILSKRDDVVSYFQQNGFEIDVEHRIHVLSRLTREADE